MNNVVVTITGPSASGKSTLESKLCDVENGLFHKVVSHTTRPPRAGEVDGKDYFFVTQERFILENLAGNFAETVKFGNASYGAHTSEFKVAFAQRKIAVVVCEPNGQQEIKNFCTERGYACVAVYVTNPAQVRYARLLWRFLLDMEGVGLMGKAAADMVDKFAVRLGVVASVEERWGDDLSRYDITFDAFNETNTTAVVGHVCAEALNALSAETVQPSRRWV